ncbi:hypothetical protein D9756_008942 [Leucocoprinus leucothites]|uniref:Uncharacterized protein n=1 Tax=Leucocoprinus leucothites TaxID=201217 RepID=A0A8H5FUR4_9AGAR|nr:hypothetical protein D9756_008942 [Leucoagaricus leucothites]
MCSQLCDHVTQNQISAEAPDFPHAWTFSAQRYVPRPRPVARIILPSHHRANDSARPEVLSPAVAFSSSDSLPLLRLAHEGDNRARFGQDTWLCKLYYLYKRLGKLINGSRKKTTDGLVRAWLPIRKGFQPLKKPSQGSWSD